MEDSEGKEEVKSRFTDTRIIAVMVFLTAVIVVCMFIFNNVQNNRLTAINSNMTPRVDSIPTPADEADGLSVSNNEHTGNMSYKRKREELERDYDLLIKNVQEKLKSAKTVHQQDAISSYYTMEAMELLLKQNNLLIEQNEKIIELLTELKNK